MRKLIFGVAAVGVVLALRREAATHVDGGSERSV